MDAEWHMMTDLGSQVAGDHEETEVCHGKNGKREAIEQLQHLAGERPS